MHYGQEKRVFLIHNTHKPFLVLKIDEPWILGGAWKMKKVRYYTKRKNDVLKNPKMNLAKTMISIPL